MESDAIKSFVKKSNGEIRKVKKMLKPYMPLIMRALIVATFIEDGIRVLFDMKSQILFLKEEYYLPSFISGILLLVTTIASLIASGAILSRKPVLEKYGSYFLIGFIFYQQILYGRHSPIGSGNLGFLMRNLCLAGSLLMIVVQGRISDGVSALPGIPDPGDKNSVVIYLQLASRLMIVLLSLEFLTTLGPIGTLIALPIILAVLAGYRVEISGTLLVIMYFLHNILNSAFWQIRSDSARASFDREVKRYEFVQTLSIMGGLMMLITLGPGSLSVDEQIGRRKNF
eukprot:CAMPEP_0182443310 /NCGR_PEP_ID=MMETSP1172-20130603/2076_1 /TAXON_ID=708627 /ORGANISM="Timspurckia oligopyrenoides, Strain CCMP3278" /LENGTH=284 /DNA_ID=CAMNT_0024638545 /DNA_START=113 /DNA_END=967 /DNA_ORIENTATION=-